MGQTEYRIFVVLATVILLVFIVGIIVFILQYHRRKLVYEKEKAQLNEQHIQELFQSRLEIQNQTMQNVGREIHDNVGQRLTLASIHANKLAYDNKFPEINDKIEEIGKIITESLADLRSISRNLTNANTDLAEFWDLVEEECKRVRSSEKCDVSCYFNTHDFTISNTNKNFLLRIIQEFLSNSLKHSECKNILLDFKYNAEGLVATIKDDGKGFDPNNSLRKPKEGIGLLNMKKRAELIGANFSLSSIVGDGTTLRIFIPQSKLNV